MRRRRCVLNLVTIQALCNATRTLEPGIVSTLSKYRHSFGILLASKTYVVSPPSIDSDGPKLQRRRPPESPYDECSSQQTVRRMWVTKAMHLISQLFFLVFVRGPYFTTWDFRLRLRIFQDLGLDSRRCSTLSGYNTTILERSNEEIAQIGGYGEFPPVKLGRDPHCPIGIWNIKSSSSPRFHNAECRLHKPIRARHTVLSATRLESTDGCRHGLPQPLDTGEHVDLSFTPRKRPAELSILPWPVCDDHG
jgi:hypothetical protein